jgi:glycosyltransferase involved in cell wall biosynthesis
VICLVELSYAYGSIIRHGLGGETEAKMKPEVIVYRHQLFKFSEPFIAAQAQSCTKFAPIYVGRRAVGTPPEGAQVITLREGDFLSLTRHVFLRDPTPFLKYGLQNKRPALLHAHFGVEGVYALPLAQELGIPLITTFRGFDVTVTAAGLVLSGKVSWLNYALFRNRLAQNGTLFLCVSDYLHAKLIGIGFPKERIITHYNGIDVTKILPNFQPRKSNLILQVARLVEKKGTEYLIESFRKITVYDKNCSLFIVGDGPLRKKLVRKVSSYGLQDRVIFLGVRSHQEVLDLMQKAIVLVQPSVTARTGDSEGLGSVFLEAAASGIPVIGTRHGGIPEAVVDGVTGFLVPERDADALAEKLLVLLSDKSLREEMGRAGRKMVEDKFDMRRQTEKLEKIYEGLL